MTRQIALLGLFAILAAPSAGAAEWHVDPAGDDGARGDLAAPLRTIRHAVKQVAPGDTVVIHPGTYVETVDLTISGTAEAPITVRALPGAEIVAPASEGSWEGVDVASGVGHLVLEGIRVAGFAESILLRGGAHDIVVRDCEARDGRVGLWIAGATRVTVERCVLEDNQRGLRISGAASAVTVQDTRSAGNDDGLGCAGDADGFAVEETVQDVAFLRCQALGNSEDGFDLQGDRVLVAQSESRANGCGGIKLAQNARVENTLVAGNKTGIAVTSFFGAPVLTELINDTIADNAGVQLLLRAGTADPAAPSTVVLRNLIVAGPGKLLEAGWPLALVEDHNLFFRPDQKSGAIVQHRADGEHRYSCTAINAGVWAQESGQGIGTFAADPQFVDTEHYTVGADSPAIDAGSADGAPDVDRTGAPRPAGAGPDIGCDEAPAATDSPTPSPQPTATATPQEVHDSSVRAPSGRVRLRIRARRDEVTRKVVVKLWNEDTKPVPELPGHPIRLAVDLGDCAPVVRIASISVPATGIIVRGGSRARATIRLVAEADTVHTPDPRTPFRCTAQVRVIGPGTDPTPANDGAPLHIEVRDDNDRVG